MLVVVVSILTAILLVAGTYQATYSKSPWTKKPLFKAGFVSLSMLAGGLMVASAWRDQRSQEELEQSIAGISQTVFLRDVALEFQGAYDLDESKKRVLQDGTIVVSVLPKTAKEFCKWGVTHTPSEDSSLGAIFDRMSPNPPKDILVGFGDSSVQIFKFELRVLMTNGSLRVVGAPGPLIPLVVAKNMAMDDYLQSQFMVEFIAPGKIRGVEYSVLTIKGKPVPLKLVDVKGRWLGSTVFRPTWERYCEPTADR